MKECKVADLAYPNIVVTFKDFADININEPELLDPARVFFVGLDAGETVDSIKENYEKFKPSEDKKNTARLNYYKEPEWDNYLIFSLRLRKLLSSCWAQQKFVSTFPAKGNFSVMYELLKKKLQ